MLNPPQEKPIKSNQENARKFLVQTPKIKPVGGSLLSTNFNP